MVVLLLLLVPVNNGSWTRPHDRIKPKQTNTNNHYNIRHISRVDIFDVVDDNDDYSQVEVDENEDTEAVVKEGNLH